MKSTSLSVIFLLLASTLSLAHQTDTIPNRVNEARFIRINGIDIWVTIKGNPTKPVVLFLHGGPGSPLTPYADAIFGWWENDFILVQWDQRGAGKTFGAVAPEELTPAFLLSNPLQLEQMVNDGIQLSQYLLKYLAKDKLILFGSSWGSILGVKMAQTNPDLFYAYIGHSQVVNPSVSNLYAYNKVLALARSAADESTLSILRAIGKPPYDTARNMGRFLQVVKRYQQKNADTAPASWFNIDRVYDNEKDNRHRSDGDDYSFVNYTGDKKLGISPIASNINLFEDGTVFNLPVYLIQGEEDLQTPAEINQDYFDKMKAPIKKLFLLPKTEHGFNRPAVGTFRDILNSFIVTQIR